MPSTTENCQKHFTGGSLLAKAGFHLVTLWLFTVRDIPALVIPQTAFGIIISSSGYATTRLPPTTLTIMKRIPLVFIWNWANVLLFSLANQRLHDSIQEDRINKPWRPLPSNRISEYHARRLLLSVIPCVLIIAAVLGGMLETLLLIAMTWMYNDLGGADESFITRNLLNALGITCYSSASTLIACNESHANMSTIFLVWLGIVCGIVFTTMQIMDLADMDGDRIRGRKTLPLMRGEQFTRLSVIICVIAWSFVCPSVWDVQMMSRLACIAMGSILAARTYYRRGALEDKQNFHLWSVWTITLYFLPLLKHFNM